MTDENYWNECERTTGAHRGKAGEKTAKTIGRPGAWTLKARCGGELLVGCCLRAKSDFNESSAIDHEGRPALHVAVCEHQTVKGASSRSRAIKQARKPAEWCDLCSAAIAAL